MMARVTCEAKRRGIVKRRGNASIEFYINGEPQYYCYGYYDKATDVPLEVCQNCTDFVYRADEDLKRFKAGEHG